MDHTKGESAGSRTTVQRYREAFRWVKDAWTEYGNLRAATAGVTLVTSFVLISQYLSDHLGTTTEMGPFRRMLVVLFIGLSTGFYVGKAIGKEGGPINSFLLGFFGSLGVLILFVTDVSILAYILLLVTVTSFLMYNSGLVESHAVIDKWIANLVAVSLYGLVVLWAWHYVVPLVTAWFAAFGVLLVENPRLIPFVLFALLVGGALLYRFVDYERWWETAKQLWTNRINRFVD